jgi:hypothetical protein
MKRSPALISMASQLAIRHSRSHTASQLLAGLANLAEAASNLEKLAVRPDPGTNPVTHAKYVKQKAEQYSQLVSATETQLKATAKAAQQKIQDDIYKAARLTPSLNAQEQRGVFRTLPKSEQLKVLKQAVESKDYQLIADLNAGTPLINGLDAGTFGEYLEAHLQNVCPDLCAERDSLNEIMGSLPVFIAESDRVPGEFVDEAQINRLIQDEASSRQAQMEFSSNMRDGLDPLIAA